MFNAKVGLGSPCYHQHRNERPPNGSTGGQESCFERLDLELGLQGKAIADAPRSLRKRQHPPAAPARVRTSADDSTEEDSQASHVDLINLASWCLIEVSHGVLTGWEIDHQSIRAYVDRLNAAGLAQRAVGQS